MVDYENMINEQTYGIPFVKIRDFGASEPIFSVVVFREYCNGTCVLMSDM